jgi:hypothetical protein
MPKLANSTPRDVLVAALAALDASEAAPRSPRAPPIADDLVIGGPLIAQEIGCSYRQLAHMVATGKLGDAVTKLGPKMLVASRSKLRAKLGLAPANSSTAA